MDKIWLVYIDDENSASSEAGSVHYSSLVRGKNSKEVIAKLLKSQGNDSVSDSDIKEAMKEYACMEMEIIE